MFFSVLKIVFFCLYASIYSCSSNGTVILPKGVSVSAVIAFGDSFVDQGNNNYINTLAKANFPPYGKDFVGEKPTGRFSNGKTPPDFFATAAFFFFFSIVYVCFALRYPTGLILLQPPQRQLDMFKEYMDKLKRNVGEEATANIIKNTVVVVVAGFNDLTLSLPLRSSQYAVPAYINMLVKLILSFLQELNTLGARRILVFSTPPIGCFPATRTLAGPDRRCDDRRNNEAKLFNSILNQQLQKFSSSFTQSRVVFVDFYNPLLNIIQNPQNYGLKVTDRGCCGTGELEVTYLCNRQSTICPNDSEFFFWDSLHLSDEGYAIFVNLTLHDLVNNLF